MRTEWLRFGVVLSSAAVLLAIGARTADAQEIQVCYVPKSGTIYVVGTDDTKPDCASPKHVPATLSLPLQVAVNLTREDDIAQADATDDHLEHSVLCPTGTFVMGGGASVGGPPGRAIVQSVAATTDLHPVGWFARAENLSGPPGEWSMRVEVICGELSVTEATNS